MSKHEVLVIKVDNINVCPNADSLEIINIWDYQCVVRKGQYKIGDLIAFIEPDYEVPLDRDEFKFLDEKKKGGMLRITIRKFRKNVSYGLIIPAPEGSIENENVMEILGVKRWEPKPNPRHRGGSKYGPIGFMSGFQTSPPPIDFITYDLENVKKHIHLVKDGMDVVLTEKIHGTNARYVFTNNEFYAGSRTTWKMKPGITTSSHPFVNEDGNEEIKDVISPNSNWWSAAIQNPWIEEWCIKHPDMILCGEVYGPHIQGGYNYGKNQGEFGFAAFDIFDSTNNKFIDNIDLISNPLYCEGIAEFAPILYTGPLDYSMVKRLAEEDSVYPNQSIREGVVIKPYRETMTEIGRLALKYVSDRYWQDK